MKLFPRNQSSFRSQKQWLEIAVFLCYRLRWPDTIYLHIGRLFSIQIFDHSASFDCRDILDAEKGMLQVYQKRITFIEIDTNLRQFSRTLFAKKMRIIGKMKRRFSFMLL